MHLKRFSSEELTNFLQVVTISEDWNLRKLIKQNNYEHYKQYIIKKFEYE